jgi:hypothetical protein
MEEQRILGCLLHIVFYHEFRAVYAEPSATPEVWQHMKRAPMEELEAFWPTFTCSYDSSREQLATALLWLDEQANGRENISTWLGCAAASKEDGQCCEHYTVLETEKEEWDKTDYHHLRLGQSACWYRLLDSRRMAYSPLMHMEFSTIRPYGFVLWEATRMTALGFHPKGSPMPWWFALSSIFTDDDWEGIIERQRARPYHIT